jgi:hypothetical protein
MPKVPSASWKHFNKQVNNNKVYAFCKYCNARYFSNATRMEKHLTECKKCPTQVKSRFSSEKSLCSQSNLPQKGQNTPAVPVASSCADLPALTISAGTSALQLAESRRSEAQLLSKQNIYYGEKKPIEKKPASVEPFCDRMTPAVQNDLDECLARAFYATGTPFSTVENTLWLTFFQKLRPSYKVPSRYALANTLLDKEDERISEQVAIKIAEAESVAVISDGWTNVNNSPVINFIIATPDPVFLRSVTTDENRHTGDYIAELLIQVIEEVGSQKVMAVITDNASNMKAAWKIITAKYGHIYCYGCIAHGLHLLATDLCRMESVDKLLTRAKDIVKFVKNKQIPLSVFRRIQQERHKNSKVPPVSLVLPSTTRWGTIAKMLERLLATKRSLQHMVVEDEIDAIIHTPVKSDIMDNSEFWPQIENLLAVLKPIADSIKYVESDKPRLADIPQIFLTLKQSLTAAAPTAPVKNNAKIIMDRLAARELFCSNVLQRVAHMLHPKYCGALLSDEEVSEVFDEIIKIARFSNCNEAECLADLAEFRSHTGLWKNNGMWEAASVIPANVWWKGFCAGKSLALVASRVLNLPASSAASERNWSTFKHIQSSKRNRLTDKRSNKLVNVKFNLGITSLSNFGTTTAGKSEKHIRGSPEAGACADVVSADSAGSSSTIQKTGDGDEVEETGERWTESGESDVSEISEDETRSGTEVSEEP